MSSRLSRDPSNGHSVSRRFVLRSLAGSLALPALPSLTGKSFAVSSAIATTKGAGSGANRFVAIGNLLGFQRSSLFPKTEGMNYESTPVLEPVESIRDRLTIYRGLDHGLRGGHFAVHTFLSGVLHHEAKHRPDGNVTLDQFIADAIGQQTRFASLTVGSEGGIHGGCQLSWTRSGVRVPPITGPADLFDKLFVEDPEAIRKKQSNSNAVQASILDVMKDEASSLTRRINQEDKAKLDEYFSSIRDVERKLQSRVQWGDQPKPKASFDRPSDKNTVDDLPMLYELIALALQTDSTRVATLEIGGSFLPQDLGISKSYHGLSHHGNDPKAIEDLVALERYQLKQFGKFVERLSSIHDGEQSLLDSTAVLFGSGIGDANTHKNDDLPILMAGGGYGGKGYRVVSTESGKKVPLCNLFLDIAQSMGIQSNQFGTSTSTFS